MAVSVLVPFRGGDPYRDRAWGLVRASYAALHPEWEVVTGSCADGPFNRSEAVIDAALKSSGDVLVVADADVWTELRIAVTQVKTWAIPHCAIHRLSQASTERVLAGEDWRGLELSQENTQDRRPYRGNETGTCYVIKRDVLFEVPPDVRFRGWGQEDQAHALALHLLIGRPWRGTEDLVHLWHPPQERMNRKVGSREGQQLLNRYRACRVSPDRMRALVNEGATWRSPTS